MFLFAKKAEFSYWRHRESALAYQKLISPFLPIIILEIAHTQLAVCPCANGISLTQVRLLKQRLALIMAPDRHAAIAEAMSILSFSRPLIRALHDLQPDPTRTRRL